MRLLLHIGAGKTGTSTLQQTLRKGSRALAHHGVLYPRAGRGDSHADMVCSFRSPERLPRGFGALRARSTVRDIGDAFWDEVKSETDKVRPDVVILSSEHLFSNTPDELSALRTVLDDRFEEVEVVAYVRHPAAHYVSLTQQKVKAAHAITPPSGFKSRGRVELTRHQEHFERVSARPFDRSMLRDGCVVRDFLTTFVPDGASLAERITVVDVNETMSAAGMCIMQSFRRHGWPDRDDEFVSEGTVLLELLQEAEDAVPSAPPALLPWIRAAMTTKNAAELDWLREHFGVTFPVPALTQAVPDPMPAAWWSGDLTEILDIDRTSIDHLLYEVLQRAASRSLSRRGS